MIRTSKFTYAAYFSGAGSATFSVPQDCRLTAILIAMSANEEADAQSYVAYASLAGQATSLISGIGGMIACVRGFNNLVTSGMVESANNHMIAFPDGGFPLRVGETVTMAIIHNGGSTPLANFILYFSVDL